MLTRVTRIRVMVGACSTLAVQLRCVVRSAVGLLPTSCLVALTVPLGISTVPNQRPPRHHPHLHHHGRRPTWRLSLWVPTSPRSTAQNVLTEHPRLTHFAKAPVPTHPRVRCGPCPSCYSSSMSNSMMNTRRHATNPNVAITFTTEGNSETPPLNMML